MAVRRAVPTQDADSARVPDAAHLASAPPVLLTVAEALAVLRIGRTTLDELAREYLATGGASGIPAVRIGKQLRFPRAALEELIGTPIPDVPTVDDDPASRPSPRRRSTRGGDSPQLFQV